MDSDAVFLLTAGSLLLVVELLCSQLCLGDFLLTIGVFYLQLEIFCLQWESSSNEHLHTAKKLKCKQKSSNCK